jgi:hypothetical protein
MDAMDRMDDDGSPESEEMHEAAADQVEQIAVADSHHTESSVEQARVEEADSARAEAAPAPPAESAPAEPVLPDHADHDPQ